jgi:hypothetical protein
MQINFMGHFTQTKRVTGKPHKISIYETVYDGKYRYDTIRFATGFFPPKIIYAFHVSTTSVM